MDFLEDFVDGFGDAWELRDVVVVSGDDAGWFEVFEPGLEIGFDGFIGMVCVDEDEV